MTGQQLEHLLGTGSSAYGQTARAGLDWNNTSLRAPRGKPRLLACALAATTLMFITGASAQQPNVARAYHPEHVLVRFKPDAPAAAKQASHGAARARRVLREYHIVKGLQLVEVPSGDVLPAIGRYQQNANVLHATPDYAVYPTGVPNDPDFGQLWGIHHVGQTVDDEPCVPGECSADADIDAVQAWDVWTGDPQNPIVIAVIDTGIDYNHPDLAANVWTNPAEEPFDANGDGCPGICGVDDDGDVLDLAPV